MINVIHVQEPAELFCKYPGQFQPQSCYVELDLRDGTLSADYNAEIGNAVPFAVWHGHKRRYTIPCLIASEANELLDRLVPTAERMIAGYESKWNGNNHIAILNEDAEAAEAELESIVAEYDFSERVVHWADADDWLYDEQEDLRKRLQEGGNIEKLEAELDGMGEYEDRPVLLGVRRYLENLRTG